jgi:23S rRNA pseudouridine2457 synthase
VLIVFNKPYGVLSQFTADGSPNRALSDFGFPKGVYPIGRLDADSEGLLLLSDETALNERLLHPRNAHERSYWAQVERIPCPESLAKLERGLTLQDYRTRPCRAYIMDPQPVISARIPPIRIRKNVLDVWLELRLTEGKNRQVRRMTAAIGHPTLRLIRVAIGEFRLAKIEPGAWREATKMERQQILA